MKNQNYICVFDCESVPDTELLRKIYGFEGDDLSVCKQGLAKSLETSGSEFLALPFHKIVSICAVITDEFGRFIKVNKIEGENEKEMIYNFFNFIDKSEPRLVSFNGKNFDMPLLVLRALKYNIKASTYLDTISNKWDNYKSRYSESKHCDLFESLGGFNARGLKLDTLCVMANLPGKYDVSGDQVYELYHQNKLEQIHEYCESDTLNTYMLFLKYELIKENLNDEDYKSYLLTMKEYLQNEKKNRNYVEIFAKACDEEVERINEA